MKWSDMNNFTWSELSDFTWSELRLDSNALIKYLQNNNLSLPVQTYEKFKLICNEAQSYAQANENSKPIFPKKITNNIDSILVCLKALNECAKLYKNLDIPQRLHDLFDAIF